MDIKDIVEQPTSGTNACTTGHADRKHTNRCLWHHHTVQEA